MKNYKRKIEKFIKKLPLTEKLLLIFMTLIYSQIIYNLFNNELQNNNTSPIDTILRTSAASIFGYFLGTTPKNVKSTNTHTIIIFILGVSSLLILLYIRNFTNVTNSSIASISQLKDFVFATVGFLVSRQKEKS